MYITHNFQNQCTRNPVTFNLQRKCGVKRKCQIKQQIKDLKSDSWTLASVFL